MTSDPQRLSLLPSKMSIKGNRDLSIPCETLGIETSVIQLGSDVTKIAEELSTPIQLH